MVGLAIVEVQIDIGMLFLEFEKNPGGQPENGRTVDCLLYTSDAADE